MAYVGLEDFLSRLEPSQQQQVKSAATTIELHWANARHAKATKDKLGLPVFISGMCFLMVVGDFFFHNGAIHQIQQLLGGVGIAAATLTGPILGGHWLKAKLTADRENLKALNLNNKWFHPFGGMYSLHADGRVYVSDSAQ